MTTNEQICMMALTRLDGVGDVLARHLISYFGTAENVFTAKSSSLEKVPGIGKFTAERIINTMSEALRRAEKELTFVEKNKIRIYTMTDDDYPARLKECSDAPVIFFYKGTANLNATKILSIVGTRHITDYGRRLTETLIADLAELFPGLIVVSGLAFGIDVCAHRFALKNKLSTVGVLAHGLDRIYPAAHRNTAVEMLAHGGLMTDFMSETKPDRENFLRRNRLIAGLSDATIVVESAEKGGALITADIAFSYGRDVYTFPGRTTDIRSLGCNRLILMSKAGLINSAKDLIMSLCWDVDVANDAAPLQNAISFPERPDHPIIRLLEEKGEFQINQLSVKMNIPIHKLTAMLFELELEGHIRAYPGGIYKLT